LIPGVSKKEGLDWPEFAKGFIDFTEKNSEQCSLIFDIDAPECPQRVRRDVRNHLDSLPNTVMFPAENETLEELSGHFERIGVNSRLAKSMTPNELRRVRATLYGSNVLDLKTLRTGRFAATTTMAWLSPRRYGELWVYSGAKLWHHKAERLQRAVRGHRATIEMLGFDPEKCAANDRDELTGLAIRSMLAMADSFSKRPRDREAPDVSAPESQSEGEPPETEQGVITALFSAESTPKRSTSLLPVISMKEEMGNLKAVSTGDSMRRCDTCNLSGSCPGFESGATCKFSFPVEIATRAQWQAASQVLLETQFDRAMFSHFSDQVDGGMPSKSTGVEIDRFFKTLTAVKELEHIDPPHSEQGAISKALHALEASSGHEEIVLEEDYEEATIEAEYADDGFARWEEDAAAEGRTQE
jgi:hypothetical protein